MMIAPCKDCHNRHLHCHSECDAYKEYAEMIRKVHQQESESGAIGTTLKRMRMKRLGIKPEER